MLQDYIVKFAAGDQSKLDLFDLVKDYYNHYMAVNFKGTAEFSKKYSLDEKEKILNGALLKEIGALANIDAEVLKKNSSVFASNPLLQWATFAVVGMVTDVILPDAIIKSTGYYNDVRVIGYGDSASWEITPRDLFVVTKASKGKRLGSLQKQYQGQVTLVPEDHLVSVYVDLYRVLAGLESLGAFLVKVARSIETQMALDVYTAFDTAMKALPSSGNTQLKYSGYSEAVAVSAAQKVTAWNGGKPAVFLGTKAALSHILPADANYRFELNSDYVKVGYIRDFKGYEVIELQQVADYTTPFGLALKDDVIYVVSPSSDKLIRTVIGGDMISYTNAEYGYANLIQTGTMRKAWATAVATSSIAAIITL